VRLVASVVFSAESPVNLWKNWLILEADRAEDAAAYELFPLSEVDR
jgi:hypothetical protein